MTVTPDSAAKTCSLDQMPAPRGVSLLDADADLAALVVCEEMPTARRRAVVQVHQIERGLWRFEPFRDPAAFGVIVLEGLLGARVAIGGEAHLEVLGEGDVLRPWACIGSGASVPSTVGWRVFEDTTVGVLDGSFARRIAPWPELAAALMHRLVLRARRLSFQLALAGIERVDERLLIVLWHFADRWGRVTPEGVRLRLGLTHAQLGEVVRVARPSVTTAISGLRRSGALSVEGGRRTWVLHGEPPPVARELSHHISLG